MATWAAAYDSRGTVINPPRNGDRPSCFSDILVRADPPYQALQDTFGKVAGYAVKDSQSGYLAFRHRLPSEKRTAGSLYRGYVGQLMNPQGLIETLAAGRIDVGLLDSYCHDLL